MHYFHSSIHLPYNVFLLLNSQIISFIKVDKLVLLKYVFCHNSNHSHCLSRLMRKPTICIGKNKDTDQLRGDREADQRLCFCYSDVQFLYFLNPKFQASSHLLCLYSSICDGPAQTRNWLQARLSVYPPQNYLRPIT